MRIAQATTASTVATRRWVRNRPARMRRRDGSRGSAQRSPGQKSARPKSAIAAGIAVTATASVISTVTAIPGPKARKKPRCPITSEPEPTATISPAVTTIGRTERVVRSTASRRCWPSTRPRRAPERKKTA